MASCIYVHIQKSPAFGLPAPQCTPCAMGEYLRRALLLREQTRNILIFTPSQSGPEGEQTLWPQKLHEHPSFP